VGLGFGMQKLAANYVSGFVVLFERSVRIGDTVRVDNFEGVVADIKTRYTLIRSLSGRESIVPNEKLITERIENLTLDDPNLLVSTELVLGNDVDLEAVQRILLEAPVGVPRVLAKPEPAVRLTRFTADGIEFSVQFWIADPQNGTGNVKSDVNLRVLRALRGAGIEFPTTQRIVRLGPPLTSSATAATG
jgi:small-conductance mechanosensitive channel